MDLSIRDFQQGKAGYVANALEQSLLLPLDMDNLRTLKRDLAMVRASFGCLFRFLKFFLTRSLTYFSFARVVTSFSGNPNSSHNCRVGRSYPL